nr:lipid phosphate phosphatase 2-like isoform X1 [Ipomoea batatas]
MREIQVEQQTVRSHGVTVARSHITDWLILLLLLVILVVLNVIHPFYRFVGRDMVGDFKYPLKNNTVPIWAVPIYAVLLPIFIFLLFYCHRKDVYDLHHAILGVLFSVLVTGVITDAVKDAVGRPRPDFFWRCFPDGNDVSFRPSSILFLHFQISHCCDALIPRFMIDGETLYAMVTRMLSGKATRVFLAPTLPGLLLVLGFCHCI